MISFAIAGFSSLFHYSSSGFFDTYSVCYFHLFAIVASGSFDNHPVYYFRLFAIAGSGSFDNYSVRYREGLDLVLKDLNFSIKDGERIGIVGRTGDELWQGDG